MCLFWIRRQLQNHGDDCDEGRTNDGKTVVVVVPRDFSCNVLDLAEPQPDADTETCHPEEDGQNRELMEETKNDATAAVDDEFPEDRTENGDGKGNCKEEAHWNLDPSDLIIPQLIDDTIEDDDNDDADDTDTHDNNLCCLT